ncbi:hypothetical protein DFQ28_005230 [Apophysomyces sp. BC1034]|nr:hypothetical protein DFQ28_005230 [Apophysomyces sp. BC1034]
MIGKINSYMNSHLPGTLGEHVDFMAARLLSADLSNHAICNALKLALSRIIDGVNSSVNDLYRNYLQDNCKWDTMPCINLPVGMQDLSKKVFTEVLKEGEDDNGDIDKRKISIAIARRKLDLFVSGDFECEVMQVLCILEQVVKDCLVAGREPPNKQSELTYYKRVSKLLDIALHDEPLQLLDGEVVSKVTSSVARKNAILFGVNNASKFGRRIDLIISSNRVELSTNEWKRSGSSESTLSRQQSKNFRSNKAILKNILSLPLQDRVRDKVFSTAMDWNGDQTGLVGFEWCEANPESYTESTVEKDTWKHGPLRNVDGLGYSDLDTDVIVMEASSG